MYLLIFFILAIIIFSILIYTNSNKYKEKKELKEAAEKGDPEAQYKIALKYSKEHKDYKTAVKWLTQAAEQNHIESQYMLGIIFETGFGEGLKDINEAKKWFRNVAETGDSRGQYALARIYANTGQYEKALSWCEKAAEQGAEIAQFYMGESYYRGKGVQKNFKIALEWFEKAAKQGHPKAQYMVGLIHYEGNGVQQDYNEALDWIRKAAKQENADAQYHLGTMYRNGTVVLQDYKSAFEWFSKASENDHPAATRMMGLMFFKGQGDTHLLQDKFRNEAAVKYFVLAASMGDETARFWLNLITALSDNDKEKAKQIIKDTNMNGTEEASIILNHFNIHDD